MPLPSVVFEYSPLPVFVDIGPSDIHGQGLIANRIIPANSNLGISHVDVRKFPEFRAGYFHEDLIRTPLGGFLNHSENPNCIIIEQKHFWFLWTTETVEEGEELTVNYSLYRCGYKVCSDIPIQED